MQIQGPAHLHGSQPINGPHRTQNATPQQSADTLQGADQLDLSPEAELIGRVHDLPDVRADRVADIRQQIEAGSYETEAKLDIAVGRLLDELAG